MTAHNIFETISSQYFQLTNSEKKVADYVLRHRIDVQYMSISELAEECTVADATISRFCRRLGLTGYNAFKLELAKASMTRDSHRADAAILQESSGFHAMCKKLLGENVAVLEQTIQLLDPRQVSRAVDLLRRSRRVVCMGQGSSMLMAEEAAHLFSTVSSKFFSIYDSHLQISAAATMTAKAVLFFISYSGATTEMEDILSQAKQNGATIIMLTRFCKSPGAEKSDIVLQCGSNESPLQQGSVAAKIAQFYVLDILYHEYCSKNPEASARNKEKIMRALANRHQ